MSFLYLLDKTMYKAGVQKEATKTQTTHLLCHIVHTKKVDAFQYALCCEGLCLCAVRNWKGKASDIKMQE